MPAIFGDHMVLQRNIKIPVWGTGAPGEEVTVSLGKGTRKTKADAEGNWRVDLPATEGSGKLPVPQILTVQGTNTLKVSDVLVGDVWVASGQSNMEFGLGGADKGPESVAAANEPQIRLFCVAKSTALTPQKELTGIPPDSPLGTWQVCTPTSSARFSAVAYFFGRDIQRSINQPVGLIGTYWGGTPAQAWTSVSGLEKAPELAHYLQAHAKLVADQGQTDVSFPKMQAEFQAAKAKWDEEVGEPLKAKLVDWKKEVAQATVGKKPLPPEPKPLKPMPKPPFKDGGPHAPANLYNAMIAPLIPYAIKGAIWYQGEANAGNQQSGQEYAVLFPRMISDWREKWRQGDFPFLFVQLANYQTPAVTPSEGAWPWLREAQSKTLALPNTGMAVTIDIGNANDIHPKDKLDVGLRLALAARHVAYGQKLVFSGPTYDSMRVEANRIAVKFKNVGGGLTIGTPPWRPAGAEVKESTELTGFGIAGADKRFVWAKAVIKGDQILVSCEEVPAPVAVRYGWANTPPVNLYNKEGLPASPFRTDTW